MALDFPLFAEGCITFICIFSFVFVYWIYDTDRHAKGGPAGGYSVMGQFLQLTNYLEVTWRGGFVPKLLGMAMIAKLVCDQLVVSIGTMDGTSMMKSNDHHVACRYQSKYLHFLNRSLPEAEPYDYASYSKDAVWRYDLGLEKVCIAKVKNKSETAANKVWCRDYLLDLKARKYDIICILPAIVQALTIGHEIAEFPPYGEVWKDFMGCVINGEGCEISQTFAMDFILTRTGAAREITVRNRGSKRVSRRYFLDTDAKKYNNTDYHEYWYRHATQWINTNAIKETATRTYIFNNRFNAVNESVSNYLQLRRSQDQNLGQKLNASVDALNERSAAHQKAQRVKGSALAQSIEIINKIGKDLNASTKAIRKKLVKVMDDKPLPDHWEDYLKDPLHYDRTGEIVLLKIWEAVVDVMTGPGAAHKNMANYQFDKCEYTCGQILAPSMELTDLIDALPSILAGGTIINEFSKSVAPWLLDWLQSLLGRTPVFITKDTNPDELLRVYDHLQRDREQPRTPFAAVQLVLLAAVAVFSLPDCISIIGCHFHTQLNWLVGIGAKCLLVATALVVMQLMSIFRYVPFSRQAWEEGEGEFLCMQSSGKMEARTVTFIEWVQKRPQEQFEMLAYKARSVSEEEVDRAINAVRKIKKKVSKALKPSHESEDSGELKLLEESDATLSGLITVVYLNTCSDLLKNLIRKYRPGCPVPAEPSSQMLKHSLSKVLSNHGNEETLLENCNKQIKEIKVELVDGDPEDEETWPEHAKKDLQNKEKEGVVLLPLLVTFVVNQTISGDHYVLHDKLHENAVDKDYDVYQHDQQNLFQDLCKKKAFQEDVELAGETRMFGLVLSRSPTAGKVVVLLQDEKATEDFFVCEVAIKSLIDAAPRWTQVMEKVKELKVWEKCPRHGDIEGRDAERNKLNKTLLDCLNDLPDKKEFPDFYERDNKKKENKRDKKRRESRAEREASGYKGLVRKVQSCFPDFVFLESSGILVFRVLIPFVFFFIPAYAKWQQANTNLAQLAQEHQQHEGLSNDADTSSWAAFGEELLGQINCEELPTFLITCLLMPLHWVLDRILADVFSDGAEVGESGRDGKTYYPPRDAAAILVQQEQSS